MKNHTNCRVCNGKLIMYLDLGMMPLSNNLAESNTDPIHNERYPLQVMFCPDCGLSQLSTVIEPEKLFGHYVYRSSISQGYKDHCRDMAVDLKARFSLTEDSFHVDIAGNDGALLNEFGGIIGGRILNVDPAENLAWVCQDAGIPILTMFWSSTTAKMILNTGFGKADLITATNVFAHVDDVKDFIKGAKLLLKKDGHLVLEFPYLIDFIENKEFDTIYQEHLSYFSIYPIKILCKQAGLNVMRVEKHAIHGGSVRVIIGYGEQDETVNDFIKVERFGYDTIAPYLKFAKDVKESINDFKEKISNLKGTVAGFAASAKGNTLLNCAGITCNTIKFLIDETPEKIGKFSPGTFIPIVSMQELIKRPPDYLLVLSWNFFSDIRDKCMESGYKGAFIIPIPEWKVIN